MDGVDWVISASRVSRHQNLLIGHLDIPVDISQKTDLKRASQSPTSCPFHLITSNTCNIPLSFQFASNMQSRMVRGGSAEGKRVIRVLPRRRERSVVLGALNTDQHQVWQGRMLMIPTDTRHARRLKRHRQTPLAYRYRPNRHPSRLQIGW